MFDEVSVFHVAIRYLGCFNFPSCISEIDVTLKLIQFSSKIHSFIVQCCHFSHDRLLVNPICGSVESR